MYKTKTAGTLSKRAAGFSLFITILLFPAVSFFFAGCSHDNTKPVVLWTNRQEFLSYAELFNAQHENAKVIVVYKENPVEAFPPAKDETPPDLVVGPWLKNERVRKNFMPLDYLFSEMQLSASTFYHQLLDVGNIEGKQYLLPVSFNMPAMIFSEKHQDLIPDPYMISLDQIQEAGARFNKRNKSKIYTSMGYAPSWDSEFLYLSTKLQGASFREAGDSFTWNAEALKKTIHFLRTWTTYANTSSAHESDFKFKYLYTPDYKLVASDTCLFAYMSSSEFFTIPAEKIQNIDYRWLNERSAIPVEDGMVSLGLYKHSRSTSAAEAFITWFMKESSQKAMMERDNAMKLNISTFGIAGGFSAVKRVNERVFPIFYPSLLRNLPVAEYLSTPNILPPRWESIKQRVILPYLEDAVDTKHDKPSSSIEQLFAEWNKQFY